MEEIENSEQKIMEIKEKVNNIQEKPRKKKDQEKNHSLIFLIIVLALMFISFMILNKEKEGIAEKINTVKENKDQKSLDD